MVLCGLRCSNWCLFLLFDGGFLLNLLWFLLIENVTENGVERLLRDLIEAIAVLLTGLHEYSSADCR